MGEEKSSNEFKECISVHLIDILISKSTKTYFKNKNTTIKLGKIHDRGQ